MGRTIRAELYYGYSLGDDENGWEFAEVDDEDYSSTPTMPWWDEDGDELSDQAMGVLLAASGFTETDSSADGYYGRRREAEAALGVTFEATGYQGGRTLLVAASREFAADCGESVEIDPALMSDATTNAAADEALANALRVLGITPKQEKPAWLLTCYYG